MTTQVLFAWIVALQLGAPRAGGADIRSDVTGTWKIQDRKHTFTERGVSIATMQFDLQGPTLQETLRTFAPPGGQQITLKYLTDGTETINEFAGQRVVCRAWWQKAQLVIEWKWQENGKGVRRILSMPETGAETMQMLVQDFQPSRIDQKTLELEKL